MAVAIGVGNHKNRDAKDGNLWSTNGEDRDEHPQNVDKVVNLLRENGIDAVSFLDPKAASADSFVVTETGVLCPFLKPEEALAVTIKIDEILLNNDYNLLKEDMNNLKENYDKCFQMNQILEKKIKNYETEFELKQMQINSLEEMVKRRSNIPNNLTNNFTENNSEEYKAGFYSNNNNNINNSYNSSSLNEANKKIATLTQDREKLIQDNMKLIQFNKKLKEQINSLNQIITDLSENNNNNNIEENKNKNEENIDDLIDEGQENNS